MKVSQELERYRVRTGFYESLPGECYGMFDGVIGPCNQMLRILASAGDEDEGVEWEHVSVSLKNRCPNWQEMSWVKDQFWNPEETVMQLHPPQSQYVNNHPNCLHLWRPLKAEIPLPPLKAV